MISRFRRVGLGATLLAGLWPAVVRAQEVPVLTLRDALREADRQAFGNRLAVATSDAEHARARQPLKGILPSARVEAGVIRTTDPIGAFGTTLRQRQVTQAAFDPARLNAPDAITNVQGGLVVELPLLNGDAWTGWRAARAAAGASDAAEAWESVSTRANVVRAYYGAILAAEKVSMLQQAERAAQAALRQVQAMVQQGLVTKADALQAAVRARDLEAQRLSADNDALTARQQLGLLLGRTLDQAPLLPLALPADSTVRQLAASDTLAGNLREYAERADVRQAQSGQRAADADRLRAQTTLLPRVNGFARYDWNDPTTLVGGRPNWTVGVMASWSLFGGGSELADVAGAAARARGARVGVEALRAQARVETETSRRLMVVALQRLDLAAQSAAQSREAWRLVEKRYAGGLATVAELLGAESSATGAELSHAAARFAVIDALATYRRAVGADPAELIALETTR